MPAAVFKSPQGEVELNALYDRALSRLGIPYECRSLPGRFGETHLLVAGPEGAPPVVLVHGAYDNAASNLRGYLPLAALYRIYALDVIGQSVRGSHTHLSPADNSYGLWLKDVLDGLGLAQAAIVGISFGAGIVLRAAACIPERISAAGLIVPSGIANGSILRMAGEIFLPWALYLLSPSRARIEKAAAPMMTEQDEDFITFLDAFLRNVNWQPAGPKLTTKAELAAFTAPVLLFVTDDDCFFPGPQVEQRARVIFPNLAGVEHLHGKHLPSRESMRYVNERLIRFFNNG